MIKLWWIEKMNGKLVSYGRSIHDGSIYESGVPNPFRLRREADKHCLYGEIPVRVKIVKMQGEDGK